MEAGKSSVEDRFFQFAELSFTMPHAPKATQTKLQKANGKKIGTIVQKELKAALFKKLAKQQKQGISQ
jgi:hypothetical protein